MTRSLLSPGAVGHLVQASYAVGRLRTCSLLQHNINDTYLVDTSSGRYVLRASPSRIRGRSAWRTREEILFELAVLRHLDQKGVPVARPLTRLDQEDISVVKSPEGERQLVVFTFADGQPLTPRTQTEQIARRYGQAVAALHAATDDFSSPYPGRPLDLDTLLEKPLTILRPLLAHRPAAWSYLHALGTALRERLTSLAAGQMETGLCHGDAQGGNASISPDGSITFFDFELCGYGWRAYDIAVFCWGAALGRVRLGWDKQTCERLCDAYLSGYAERRPLDPSTPQVIAPLVLLREFWYLGLEAAHWDTWRVGRAAQSAFFDREVAFLRRWSTEHQLE